jgi:hypothetical protein
MECTAATEVTDRWGARVAAVNASCTITMGMATNKVLKMANQSSLRIVIGGSHTMF